MYYNVYMSTKPSKYFEASSRNSGRPATQLISVRLPEELLQRLAEIGNEEGLAMSDTLRLVLERGIRSGKKTQRGSKNE